MIVEHRGKKPTIHKTAYVAPTATISGEVTVEEGCAVLFGAVLTAEGAPLVLGANSVVMENAVLRSSGGSAMQFPLTVGESCLIGPGAYLAGCTLEPGCFVASGAKIFNQAILEEDVGVAVGAIVQIKTRVPAHTRVPMQHIAYGDPAAIHPPREAPEIHAVMPFFESVFNVAVSPEARATVAQSYAKFLRKAHGGDTAGSTEAAKKPAARGPLGKTRDEPPPAQTADVAKVLDVTFYELEEARMRREAALERDKKRR